MSSDLLLASAQSAKLATCYQARGIYYALSVSALRERYQNGPRERKTAARSAAFLEAGKLRNSTARLFGWYAAAALAGYKGIACTVDDIAENCAAACACKMSGRTVSRSNGELARSGWVVLRPLPTNNPVETAPGKWVTKRINQVIFTPFLMRLCGLSHISRPTPKWRAMVWTEQPAQTIVRSGLVSSHKTDSNAAARVSGTVSGQVVDSTSGPLSAAHVEQRHIQPPSGRKPAKNAGCVSQSATVAPVQSATVAPVQSATVAPVQSATVAPAQSATVAPVPTGRTDRNRRPRTWLHLRALFLADLQAALSGENPTIADRALRWAAAHTCLSMPPIISSPVNFNRLIWTYADRPARKRRAMMKATTAPAIIAAIAAITPPDRSRQNNPLIHPDERRKAKEQCDNWDRLSHWTNSISGDIVSGDYPQAARDFAKAHSWELDQYTALIQMGIVTPEHIDPDICRRFRTLADMIGAD